MSPRSDITRGGHSAIN